MHRVTDISAKHLTGTIRAPMAFFEGSLSQ